MNEYQPTNRDKKTAPKLGKGYCSCDRYLLGFGEKCKVCGAKDMSKHKRK